MTVSDLVALALKEDMPNGDLTTDALECEGVPGRARLIAKQDLVLSGSEPFTLAFTQIDSEAKVTWNFHDSDFISKGTEVCVITATFPHLLKSERTALNFMGHLSGIATLTAQFVEEAKRAGSQTIIIDTRKTTPGLRSLEKAAVLHGGGGNHRLNLSDGIIVKENHIRAAGGITAAVTKMRKKWGKKPVEVEVTNPAEIREALTAGAERLLLDNMSLEETANALKIIAGKAKTEASGNMTLDRIQSVAKLGVDFISVGQLTHSAPNADLSLLFDPVSF